jgi:hypothetical protein
MLFRLAFAAISATTLAASLSAQSLAAPSAQGGTSSGQDPFLLRRPNGGYLIPRQQNMDAQEVDEQKFVDEKILPLALQLIANSSSAGAPTKSAVDPNGRSTPASARILSVEPSHVLLRSELLAALQLRLYSSATVSSRSPGWGTPGQSGYRYDQPWN